MCKWHVFVLLFVNYRKGEISLMQRKVFFKNTLAKSIEKDINNKVKDKQNGSLKKILYFIIQELFSFLAPYFSCK